MTNVSVIIPTHNRVNSLKRTIEALCLQTYDKKKFEVLVVADGCEDRTVNMLESFQAEFVLRIIKQKRQGAATARNFGAASAAGDLLIFLDDDVVPTPQLIQAHVLRHKQKLGQVVMGPYPPILQGKTNFINIHKRLWWNSKFQAISRSNHRYNYRDMLSGNFSIEAKLFASIGGFDASIKDCGGEDYEFGVRLIKEGVTFNYAPEALAHHYEHETSDLKRIFRRMFQEGHADLLICRRHPELRATLRLSSFDKISSSTLRNFYRLAFAMPIVGDFIAMPLRYALNILERIRARGFWLRLFKGLLTYYYWKGIAEDLGSRRALLKFSQDYSTENTSTKNETEIDLCRGLAEAIQCLDKERPTSAVLLYGKHVVGRIPYEPGMERLRGVHLISILRKRFIRPLFKAIALEADLSKTNSGDPLLKAMCL
jgi:glycosyltransferase involved in cell wall biosynthesis